MQSSSSDDDVEIDDDERDLRCELLQTKLKHSKAQMELCRAQTNLLQLKMKMAKIRKTKRRRSQTAFRESPKTSKISD